MVLWIVDAHTEYQSGLDVPRLKREGYSAIIVKATQGAYGYNAPPKFDTWIAQARQSGLIPGAYHWLDNSDPVRQVDRYLSRIGNPDGMICAVDVEDTNFPSSWNTVKTFIEEFKRRTNNHPILLYSGFWWWQSRGWNASSLTPYVWDSRYVNGSGYASNLYAGVDDSWWNTRYGGWDRTTLLQFSSKGSAGGITGNVDVNAFNGTLAQLRSLTSSTSIKPYSSVVNDREIEMFLAKGTEATVVLTDASTFCGTPDLKTVDALVAAGIPYAEGVSDAWIAELLKELPLRAKSGGFTDAQVAVLAPQLASALREALVGAGVAVDSAVIRTALSETLSSVRINVQ